MSDKKKTKVDYSKPVEPIMTADNVIVGYKNVQNKSKSSEGKKRKIDKEIIFEIDCMKNNHYPTLVFDNKAPARVEFPNFQWNTDGLKKVTKFRYFLAGIKLWYLQLKDKLKFNKQNER